MWTVPSFDVWYVRALRRPLYHSTDYAAVDRSPYPYGPCAKHGHFCWALTPLGILHRWTGLTLEVKGS
jgi:hypothetical protein